MSSHLNKQQMARSLSAGHYEQEGEMALLRRFAEGLLLPLIAVDKRGIIKLTNHAAEQQFGYEQNELLGRSLAVLLPERFRKLYRKEGTEGAAAWEHTASGHGFELTARRKDGVEFPAEINIRPLETSQGLLILCTIAEVSERQAAQKQLESLSGQLQSLDADLQFFSYCLQESLLTPLRKLQESATELLQVAVSQPDSEDPQAGRRILETLSLLSDRLRSLARYVEVTRAPVKADVAELGPLVEEAVREVRQQAPAGNIKWVIGPLPPWRCDAELLKEAFVHLLRNAVWATRSRPRAVIEVGMTEREGTPALFVRDNGVGVAGNLSEETLLPFPNSLSANPEEGMGIGLATARRILQRHGGRVWAEGEPGRGATFYLALGPADVLAPSAKASQTAGIAGPQP